MYIPSSGSEVEIANAAIENTTAAKGNAATVDNKDAAAEDAGKGKENACAWACSHQFVLYFLHIVLASPASLVPRRDCIFCTIATFIWHPTFFLPQRHLPYLIFKSFLIKIYFVSVQIDPWEVLTASANLLGTL